MELHSDGAPPTTVRNELYSGYDQQVMLESPHFAPESFEMHHKTAYVLRSISYLAPMLTKRDVF